MNKNYEISQINEFTHSLKIYGDGDGDAVNPMYKTIKKMVKSVQYDYETVSIFFSAEEVKPLKEYILNSSKKSLSYNNCIKMISYAK
jgi:hypothetical protein